MAGLLDYLFDPSIYGGQSGLLGRLSPMIGQMPQSAGFPDQQASPIAMGGYQMPRVGNPDMFSPQQVNIPENAQPAAGRLLPQPPPQLPQAQPGFFDRLNSGLQSIGNGGSLIGAATGNYTDPQSIAQQNLKAQFQAYISAGLSPDKAMLAVLNPKAAEAFLPQLAAKYQAHNVGNTVGSFNQSTGEFNPRYTEPKYEKVGPGENLIAVGGTGGGKTIASGGPEKPPSGYKWVDENDPSKGVAAIPGGPGTHLPSETAGRIAMMQTAAAELPAARKTLMEGRGGLGAGVANIASSAAGMGQYSRAERTVTLAIEGALRAMTGAAAPEVEVKRYKDLFMPSPLDSAQTATQKLNQLDDFISNAQRLVSQGRGPAGNAPQGRPSDPLGIR